MKFTKMHGAGNDYVYVDCIHENLPEEKRPEVSIKVSHRNTGIGSDGLICICPSQKADFRMDMYNADGSQGKMCGNGIRCVGKYVYDFGLTDKTHFTVETLSGIKTLDLTVENGKAVRIRVDMNEPILKPVDIPARFPGQTDEPLVQVPYEVDGKTYLTTPVSMGNPHSVIFIDEPVKNLDLNKMGPAFENHPYFPDRVNTEFVRVLSRSEVEMRVYERGSGETLCCGTGCCAIGVACVLSGLTDNKITVHALGGDITVEYNPETDGIVYMTGPAAVICTGEVDPDAL